MRLLGLYQHLWQDPSLLPLGKVAPSNQTYTVTTCLWWGTPLKRRQCLCRNQVPGCHIDSGISYTQRRPQLFAREPEHCTAHWLQAISASSFIPSSLKKPQREGSLAHRWGIWPGFVAVMLLSSLRTIQLVLDYLIRCVVHTQRSWVPWLTWYKDAL